MCSYSAALELRLGSTETQLETHSAGNIDSPVLIVFIKSFIVFFFIVGSALQLRLDVTEKHLEGLRAEIAGWCLSHFFFFLLVFI